ncbi:MAG: PQQ-binding-like beta-propeller repeat protein, partial [Gemmataceae bacterium]
IRSLSLPKSYGGVHRFTVSPDGKWIAIPAEFPKVALYDRASGRKVRSLDGCAAKVLVFSPDSTLLAIASEKPPVHLWDIRSGKKIRDLPSPKDFLFDRATAFSHDGKMAAVGSSYHAVVSEVATGKELSRLKFHNDITQGGLLFTADSKTLITGHYLEALHFWDPATGKMRFSRQSNRQQGAWPVLSRDGKLLAEADQQGRGYCFIHLLDPATGKDVGPPADGHDTQLNSIAFSLDGKTLLCGDRRTIRQWKTDTGEPGRQVARRFISDGAAVFSADRKLLALPSDDCVYLWEIGRAKPRRSLEYKGKDAIRAVAFSPDGKYLLSAHNHSSPQFGEGKNEGQDGLHFWDMATGKEIRRSSTSTTDLYSQLVITPDGRTAIAGSVKGHVSRQNRSSTTWSDPKGAGQLYLWDLPRGRQIRTLEGHRGAIRALALSGDGRLLASGSADRTVRLWELISGKTLFTLPMPKTYAPVAALSPDGRLLAIGGETRLCLYSTATGKPVLELYGHNSEVRCLAFSPDNRRLASGLRDGTALVWDVTAACRAVRPDARRLHQMELEALWAGLADTDALKAHRVIASLIAGGNDAAGMLKGRLRPAESVTAKRLQKLLTDLDADEFAVREAATRELEKLGERAEPALSAALKNHPTLEVRKRIEDLLTRSHGRELSPQRLRELRAVRVLEHIGSAEARATLQVLTNGCADAWLTQEAKASLLRLNFSKSEPRP